MSKPHPRPHPSALHEIATVIRKRGTPLTFAEFTRLCLYDPHYGYYAKGHVTIGNQTEDFTTSPELSPLFGNATARALRDMWEELHRPKRFTVIEMGAGNGTWARDILTAIQREQPTEFGAALDYIIVELSADLKKRQQTMLKDYKISWTGVSATDTGLATNSVTGVVISNELSDSFPPHRLIKRRGQLREIYVDVDQTGTLVEVEADVSPEIDPLYYEDIMQEGIEMPVQPMLFAWMEEVGRILHEGFVLTIDYGNTAELLAAHGDNFAAYAIFEGGPEVRNYAIRNALRYPGRVDITAKANFSDIMRAGTAAHLITENYEYQRDFLLRYGYALDLQLVHEPAAKATAERLIDPGDLGEFKVLIQKKQGLDIS